MLLLTPPTPPPPPMDFDPDFDEFAFEDILLPIVTAIGEEESQAKQSCRTGLPGKLYIEQLLNCQHEVRIYEVFRMRLITFYALRDWCLEHTDLKSSRKRKYIRGVTIEEKLAIFLYIVSKGASNRDAQEHFSHSGRTISRYILLFFYVNSKIINNYL